MPEILNFYFIGWKSIISRLLRNFAHYDESHCGRIALKHCMIRNSILPITIRALSLRASNLSAPVGLKLCQPLSSSCQLFYRQKTLLSSVIFRTWIHTVMSENVRQAAGDMPFQSQEFGGLHHEDYRLYLSKPRTDSAVMNPDGFCGCRSW